MTAGWDDPDPADTLALEYLKNTEDHDWRVCRHSKGNTAIPVSREEIAACTLFARTEYHRLVETCNARGIWGLWKAIKRAERHFTATYVPPTDISRGPRRNALDKTPHSRDT